MSGTANLSLDLDNKWAYLRAAGRADWGQCDSYLPIVIPRIVDMLGELNLPLTVFVVGRDLERSENVCAIDAFRSLSRWEFANHSYNHLPWLHTMDDAEMEAEIDRTSAAIQIQLNARAVGFRGPGFSCPPEVLRVLASRGFEYDASLFPTSIAPVARTVFLLRSGLKGEQRKKASKLYGGWSAALQRNHPYRRRVDDATLWELPVTTMPFTRTPIHFSYLTFLAGFSRVAAKVYFRKAMTLCRITGTAPSLLLHPLDFMGCEDDAEMAYFPGMKISRTDKLAIVRWALTLFAKTFNVKCIDEHVALLQQGRA